MTIFESLPCLESPLELARMQGLLFLAHSSGVWSPHCCLTTSTAIRVPADPYQGPTLNLCPATVLSILRCVFVPFVVCSQPHLRSWPQGFTPLATPRYWDGAVLLVSGLLVCRTGCPLAALAFLGSLQPFSENVFTLLDIEVPSFSFSPFISSVPRVHSFPTCWTCSKKVLFANEALVLAVGLAGVAGSCRWSTMCGVPGPRAKAGTVWKEHH